MIYEQGPYLFTPNHRTKRTEVFKDTPKGDVFVGSLGPDPSDEAVREMIKKLDAEVKTV